MRQDAVGTPHGAPIPDVPAVESVADVASITLGDIQSDPQLSMFIASADRVMDAMGYTEHGFRHAHLVGKIAYQVLRRLRFSEREAELARVAGYLHDMGNALTRDGHGQSGAMLAFNALRDRAESTDLMLIMSAIANHEESEGSAVSPVSAAVILADKADVHRSRVRRPADVDLVGDIHDRVNYAVEQSFLRVDSDARTVSLELTIDTKISQVMDYFEIFLGRMQMCRHAATAIDATFQLFANGQELA
ncbi:MAG TPA: HD domain-containing protein [Actinomycetota bacterium]|nr:HD domain-containing protein [Actinomycetota bacterium]